MCIWIQGPKVVGRCDERVPGEEEAGTHDEEDNVGHIELQGDTIAQASVKLQYRRRDGW